MESNPVVEYKRNFSFSLRTMLLIVAITASGLAYWNSTTTMSIREDFTLWPSTIPPDLAGREIRIVVIDSNGQFLEEKAWITDVDLTEIDDAEITIKLSLALKWKINDLDTQYAGWYCPYCIRGGHIKK